MDGVFVLGMVKICVWEDCWCGGAEGAAVRINSIQWAQLSSR